jgi:hypothetical protein
MNRDQWGDIALKGAVAAVFFFVLQFVILKASLDTSLFWSAALGIGAGLLAWSQARRGL